MSEQSPRANVIANKSKAVDRSSTLHSKNGFNTDSIYFKVTSTGANSKARRSYHRLRR